MIDEIVEKFKDCDHFPSREEIESQLPNEYRNEMYLTEIEFKILSKMDPTNHRGFRDKLKRRWRMQD
jgi:hypothetical protein